MPLSGFEQLIVGYDPDSLDGKQFERGVADGKLSAVKQQNEALKTENAALRKKDAELSTYGLGKRWSLRVATLSEEIHAKQEALDNALDKVKRLEEQLHAAQEEDEAVEAGLRLRRNADMQAIKRWQTQSGRYDTWPDHTDLCVFLMERIDELEAKAVELEISADAWADMCQRLEDQRDSSA